MESRNMRRRAFGVLLVLGFGPALTGATCSPTEPACDPGDPMCAELELLPACINFCVAWEEPDDAIGMTCSSDPCDARVLDGSFIICPPSLACIPGIDPDTSMPSTTVGTCGHGSFFIGACDPTHDLCQQGTFCREFDDGSTGCQGFNRVSGLHTMADQGACVLPQREGEPCDSNWNSTDLGAPGCLPCEPGTECLPNFGGLPVCQRPCETDDDCPCDRGEGLTGDPDTDCQESGRCGLCMGNNATCTVREADPELDTLCAEDPTAEGCHEWIATAPVPCCNPGALCNPTTVFADPPGTRRCCVGEGGECAGPGECCVGMACDISAGPECRECGGLGEIDPGTLTGEAFCCPPLIRGPYDPVEEGYECVPRCYFDPLVGEECNECGSLWECTASGLECPPASVTLSDDDCDGVDDDCDGGIDEDWEPPTSTCTASAPSECTSSTGMLTGTWECFPDEGAVCVPQNLCMYDCANNQFEGDSGLCGVGDNCQMVNACPPATDCHVDGCFTDGWGRPRYSCWLLGDPRPVCPAMGYEPGPGCSGVICWAEIHM